MSRFWSSVVHILSPYVPGEQPKLDGIVKLNTNENPYGPSPRVLAVIAAATDRLRLYPDPRASCLRETIAARASSTAAPSETEDTSGLHVDNDREESDTTMKKRKSGSTEGKGGDSPSQLIDARIAALGDWRGETLARVRSLIREADPDVVEEVKWRKPSNSCEGFRCGSTTESSVPARPTRPS